MREIKFRAWDPPTKTMHPNESLGHWKLEQIQEEQEWIFMQFTGLKDKNGKEIWEGDVLKDDISDLFEVKFGKLPLDKSGDCVCTFEAFYAKGYGKLGSPPQYECNEIGEWMEVIGNIYENPELLSPSPEKEIISK